MSETYMLNLKYPDMAGAEIARMVDRHPGQISRYLKLKEGDNAKAARRTGVTGERRAARDPRTGEPVAWEKKGEDEEDSDDSE